jgi:lysozyme
MGTKTPVRFTDLFRYYRELPHQMAALEMLGKQIPPSLLHRDNEWFKVWSQDGKQPAPSWQELATPLIKQFEGFRDKAYQCSAGVWTVGWGATYINGKAVQRADTITREAADKLLAETIDRFGAELFKLIPQAQSWPPQQIAATVSWAFNVGLGAVETSTFRRRILAGEEPRVVAAQEFPRWIQTPGAEEGLRRRRIAEVALFLS